MKTKIELEEAIMNIVLKIHGEYPELSKYITEMPLNATKNEEDIIKNLENYYYSLGDLVDKYAKTHFGKTSPKDNKLYELEGYPSYPPSEDIYQRFNEESNLNPNDLTKKKSPNEKVGSRNEKDFENDISGDDLDVPGSELDDQQESVGSEDEENNHYSLGGDNHNDLEEDKG